MADVRVMPRASRLGAAPFADLSPPPIPVRFPFVTIPDTLSMTPGRRQYGALLSSLISPFEEPHLMCPIRNIVRGAVLATCVILSSTARTQDDSFGEWISLFSGESLDGWENAKPNEGHHAGPNRWVVEDGALTNAKSGGEGNDVSTTREFEDYELEVEYKIPPQGNSGVYLRGQIEIQVFDSYGKEKWSSTDAGAIYGGNFPALVNVAKPAGEWNKFRVLHVGHRITVWHNGRLIQDNIFQDQRTGGAMSRYATKEDPLTTRRGPLMFQGDHSKVWYRNIRIRPLFQEGWKPLWNGRNMSEFNSRGDKRAEAGMRWAVEDNAFTNTQFGSEGHDIWTNGSYGNFLAYYAYRSDPTKEGGNSGFYLRDQWEIQIFGEQRTDESHSDGSLYSIRAPSVHARHAPTQWNHVFVKVVGQKISVWQNGKRLHHEIVLPTRTDNHGAPTPDFSRAPFKIQGDHGKVWFSGISLKELPDDAR
jgi:hypothetical protein